LSVKSFLRGLRAPGLNELGETNTQVPVPLVRCLARLLSNILSRNLFSKRFFELGKENDMEKILFGIVLILTAATIVIIREKSMDKPFVPIMFLILGINLALFGLLLSL
jgi:hypothetical protein